MNLYIRDRKNLLFQVNYYQKRMNFEVYHALTDGTGALRFLKELVKNYLVLRHGGEGLPDLPITDADVTIQDLENDSFSKYYKKPVRGSGSIMKRRKPCRITGSKGGIRQSECDGGRRIQQRSAGKGQSLRCFCDRIFISGASVCHP